MFEQDFDYNITSFKESSIENIFNAAQDTDTEKKKKEKKKPVIICKTCKNLITTHDKIIEINGQHSYIFDNPSGISYRIGCFSSARGCSVTGEPTAEFTWFPGFKWSFAVCSSCFNHLGWYYQSNKNNFFGLILKNLIDNF
ncbi:MAG: hypothetical protein GY754_10430 [bacterium]|nr:hypothetical protein [bacterium]